jgi:hypothetical protein
MKKKVILLPLILLCSLGSFSQVSVKLGSVENAQPGTYINVPLIVSGLSSSGQQFIGIEVLFTFQDNIITYDTLVNANSMTPLNQWFAGSIPGKVSANWLEPGLIPINVDDNSTLVEFVFLYTGGQTDLILDQSATLVYDANGNNLTVSQFIDGSVTQAQGSGSSVWNGTDVWTTAANWSNGIPGDSTDAIIASGTVELLSGGVCRNLTINSGTALVIQPWNSLTINKDFTNDGSILIKSDSLVQGSLIVRGNISQSGSSKMEMNVYNGIGYLISSPAQGTTVNMISGAGSVSAFSEFNNSWIQPPGTENLEAFSGYLFSASGDATLQYEGQFYAGASTLDLQYTAQGSASNEGWNLAGNSFTSSFDADQYLSAVNTDRAIYAWDGKKYRVWNGTSGSIPGGIIPPLTGFFIRANAANAQVTFEAEGKIHDFSHFGGSYSAPQNVLQVNLNNFDNMAVQDEAFVEVEQASTFGYDGAYDAFKLENAADYPEIYIHGTDNNLLSIDAIPEATEVEAGIKVPADGTYVISAEAGNFLPDHPVYLIDQELQITKDLRTEDYVFLGTAGDHPGRFRLVFTGLGIGDHRTETALHVYFNMGMISIVSFEQLGAATIGVYDLSGRMFSQSTADLEPGTVTNVKAISGINIIRVKTSSGIFHYKVFATAE